MEIDTDRKSMKDIVDEHERHKSGIWAVAGVSLLVIVIILYVVMFMDSYEAERYSYNVDYSTMDEVIELEEKEGFSLDYQNKDISSMVRAYIYKKNGLKKVSVTWNEDGYIEKWDSSVKIKHQKGKNTGSTYKIAKYPNESDLYKLYKSDTGYLGIYKSLDSDSLGNSSGDLELTSWIYFDTDKKMLAAVIVGKNKRDGLNIYRAEHIFDGGGIED